jgi:hypothetical protein
MVQLVPTNDNPTKNEIDAYICKMLTDTDNYNALYETVREIHGKSSVGALLHPSEEYFINSFNNSVKNTWPADHRLPDQRYNFDKARNDS